MYLSNLIRPFILEGDLIRYGNKSDGGYIVNKKYLNLSNVLYTYGVGGEVSFERDLLIDFPNYNIHLYDHTINEFPILQGKVFNHKEGLSSEKQNDCDNFLNHIKINNDEKNNILLKIDVEGEELSYFQKVDLIHFNNVAQMILEFHLDKGTVIDFINSINNINTYFYCIHVHGNNHGNLMIVDNQEFPIVLECTFINKSFVEETPILSHKDYPIEGLDFSNGGIHKQWCISYK